MSEFEPVEFKSTMVRFTPTAHAKLTALAKAAKMTKSEYVKTLMNEGVRSLRAKRSLEAEHPQ